MATQNSNNSCTRVPGPVPVFTERIVVKVRPDQLAELKRIARAFGISTSDVVRWFLDQGTQTVVNAPAFETLEGVISE